MAKIIVFGDIDFLPLYMSIDGCKEISVSGKYPQSFPLESGTHEIAATTVSKIERMTQGWGGRGFLSAATVAMQDATNTTVGGILNFAENDVLLIEVEQKGLKTNVYNKMVSEAEVSRYVDEHAVKAYGTKRKGRWILRFILGVLIALLVLMFGFVFMREI